MSKFRRIGIGIKLLLICFMLQGCYSTPFAVRQSAQSLVNQKLDNYVAHGGLDMNAVTINDSLNVNGGLFASNALLNKVAVNGKSIIENTHIKGQAQLNGTSVINHSSVLEGLSVNGRLMVVDSKIYKSLDVASDEVEVVNSNLKQIIVRSGWSPMIRLSEGTIVQGDIIFEEGQGTVVMDETSKVNGSIKSAKPNTKELMIEVGA